MRFLKILHVPLSSGSRDRREISVVRDMGLKVDVIAKAEPEGKTFGMDGVDIHCLSTRPLGERVPNALNRVASMFSWARYARRLRPDIISGHDLSGLAVAWMSTLFMPKRKRPLLVYDSHEFELGRNVQRSPAQRWMIKQLEHFMLRRSAFSIMVNDSIADEVQQIYRLDERPVVVRNIPVYCRLDTDAIAAKRREFCERLGLPDNTFIVMYHGMVMRNRGIEALLDQISGVSGAVVVMVGDGTDEYKNLLREQMRKSGVEDRVLMLDAVPIEELYKYVAAADVGYLGIGFGYTPCTVRSYYLSLPNKFFENIQSLTPVICSDCPEMKRIVEQWDIGLVMEYSGDEVYTILRDTIIRARDDAALLERFRANLIKAKEHFCWENESKVLVDAYSALVEQIESRGKRR